MTVPIAILTPVICAQLNLRPVKRSASAERITSSPANSLYGAKRKSLQVDPPCSFSGDPTSNVNLRCGDQTRPFMETAIAVDTKDPNHLLVGANDYQSPSTSFVSAVTSFVSFDGGQNWTKGNVPMTGFTSADPSPVFSAKFNTAHMGEVGVRCPDLRYLRICAYDAATVTSNDGGLTWGNPVVVSSGSPFNQVLNDKPWLAVDNDPSSPYYGRLYLSWSRFHYTKDGRGSSPIDLSYSDDDGKTWSREIEISGANPTYCNGPDSMSHDYRCLDDQFSTPVILPGGVIVVHFQNADNAGADENLLEIDTQTMIVRSTDGGVTWSQPRHIADLEDSVLTAEGGDYPARFDGFPNQTGHEFTTWSVQGMNVDPVTGVLYAFWADNRDGVHDSLMPVTQTNIFLTKSTDGGLTWTGPIRVTSGLGDRWMPWGAAYNGTVRVMFMDGSYDYLNRTLYGVTMATSTDGGSTWTYQRVDTASSNPNNSAWFSSGVSGCFRCTFFIGDYQGMTMDSLGRAHIVWTDMRRVYPNTTFKVHDIEYARR